MLRTGNKSIIKTLSKIRIPNLTVFAAIWSNQMINLIITVLYFENNCNYHLDIEKSPNKLVSVFRLGTFYYRTYCY